MLTNFPNGVSSFGAPLPAWPFVTQGKWIFVKPISGLDGNDGLSTDEAVKTLARGLEIATANQNDIVVFFAEGNSSASTTDYQSETLDWNKDLVHLVGISAFNPIGGRARIAAATTGITPLVKVSANSCYIANIDIYHGVSGDQTGLVACQVTGDRNSFYNCQFSGGGVSTTADDTGMRSLLLSDASENIFERCTIGLDTVSRTVNNYELEFARVSASDACARNIFKDCMILTYSGVNSRSFVTIGATSLDRFVLFEKCKFINPIASAATQMLEALSVAAGTSPDGLILLKDCTVVGATDWESNTESGRTYIDGAAPTNNTSGLAVLVEAT